MRQVPILALILAAACAAPAAAQSGISGIGQASGAESGLGIDRELDRIDRRAERARDAGEISRADARNTRRQTARLRAAEARYAEDGLSDAELRELQINAYALRDEARAPRRPAAAHH